MKNSTLLSVALIALTVSCQNASKTNQEATGTDTTSTLIIPDEHNSQNSLDWAGTYQDTLPCADCPGILTTVKLYYDGTYAYKAEYLERNTSIQDTGKFMWHNDGSVVHFKAKDVDTKYKVGENVLLQADSAGNIITGDMADNYSLHKVF